MKIVIVDRGEESKPLLDLLVNTPGNEVMTAQTGGQAMQICQKWGGADLLIAEVFLEPMNGFTLRNKLENRYPGIRTILMSGFDLAPYAEHIAGCETLAKPVTPQALFPAIARTMGLAVPVEPEAPPPQPAEIQAAVALDQIPLPLQETQEAAAPPAPAPVPAEPAPVPPAPVPPAPAAVPVAVPRAVAVPKATPAATPKATPAAVPKATPATPKATPVATPKATPAAVPKAVPTAVPKPVAQPAAAVPKPGIPPPKAVAAKPVATAKPAVAARPTAVPRPAVAAKPADPLIGRVLGSYRIESRIGTGKWGPIYRAIQTSMDRPVAMEVLSEELQQDEAARLDFVATARAKAAVSHPHILSVYEADQAEGRLFYTQEYVDGATLAQLAARGEGLTEPAALQTVKFVAQALANLDHQKIQHTVPEASDIYMGADGLPHLSNVARPTAGLPGVQEETHALGAIVRSVLPGGQAQDRGLQAMLLRMGMGGQAGFQSWVALFQAIQAIEPKVVPADAFKLSEKDQAAIRALEMARRNQKRQAILSVAAFAILIWLVIWAIWWKFIKTDVKDYSNDMVHIQAGQFIYQAGETKILPEFWIDRYEVTIGEYAQFLDYLAKHDNTTEFDHPLQPKDHPHIPPHWDIYYQSAASVLPQYRFIMQGRVPIGLNDPVSNVDYFDAYAYAKWKHRRLPKEEEWERAARGTNGNFYPWGNDWDPKKLNAGGDYQPQPAPGYKPAVDGYNWWAPVDAFPLDKSADGVIGMGGNVSEWTDSWDASRTYVVIRGGNFKSNAEEAKTTKRWENKYPSYTSEAVGFRTVSDTPPAK